MLKNAKTTPIWVVETRSILHSNYQGIFHTKLFKNDVYLSKGSPIKAVKI